MVKFNRNIEEIALNAFPAELVDLYDGWVIRRTKDYPSRRINSVNILTMPKPEALSYKVERCEAFLKKHNSEITFKMTNMEMHHSVDSLLDSKGYQIVTPTNVMTLELDKFTCHDTEFQHKTFSIKLEQNLSTEWLEDYIKFKSLSEKEYKALQTSLDKISNPIYYLSIRDKDQWVGAGQAVIEEGYVGLFDIAVHETYRCKGIGRIIVETLIERAKQDGAEVAYLQVVSDNEPAKRLYGKIGFQDLYQYWYRTKSF